MQPIMDESLKKKYDERNNFYNIPQAEKAKKNPEI